MPINYEWVIDLEEKKGRADDANQYTFYIYVVYI